MNQLLALLLQGILGSHQSQLISPLSSDGQIGQNIPLPRAQRVTYYLPTGNNTATGTVPKDNYTVAVSPDLLSKVPYGSLLNIGGKTYRVEDQTNPRLQNTIDIFHEATPSGIPGLQRNVPYQITGQDFTGLRYHLPKGG